MRILLFFLQISFLLPAGAQRYDLNLGVERFGLSVNEPFHTAWDMYQDTMGRIVAYTSEQKNETLTYDGKEFTKESILLPHEKLLMRSDAGGYWKLSDPFVATYVKDGKEVSLDARKYLNRNICHLYIYEGYHYLLVNDGYIKFTLKNNAIHIEESHQYPVTRINYAYFKGDTIFISQNGRGAYIMQSAPDEMIYPDEPIVALGAVMSLPNGRILVDSYQGWTEVKKNSNIYRYLNGYGKFVNNPFIDSKGRLWSNQRADNAMGLYVLYPDSDMHQKVELGIEKTNLLSCFEDQLGDIWIMSNTQGIVHLFDQTIRLLNKTTGTKTDNISAIYQSDKTGNIYVSMNYQGIDVLTPDGTSKIKSIQLNGSCQSILVDKQDRMWVIAGGVHLLQDDEPKKHFTKRDGFHSGTVTSIFEDSAGEIWAGTRQVLHRYDKDRFVKYQLPDLDVYDRIIGIAEPDASTLLLAIDNGSYYTFDRQQFEKIEVPKMIPNALFTDLQGTIWLATEDQGLFYFENNKFVAVAANEYLQLPIRNLQDSDNGMIFGLCSDNKIFYIKKTDIKTDSSAKSIQWLTTSGGLPLMDAERRRPPSTALLSSGEVVFPNVYGAIVIDPAKILAEKDSFQLAVLHRDTLINGKSIHLKYGENDIILDLANIYLNPQASFANQYKIDDGDWIDIPKNEKLELMDLPHGKNTIRVRAKHINGQWLRPVTLFIHVPALFYQRWWFYIGAPLLFGYIIYMYTQYKVKSVNARNTWLNNKVEEQTEAINQEKKQLSQSLQKQRELTQELNLSQAAKNRMYAQISHEFKSPLQAIKSHLENKKDKAILEDDRSRIKGNIDNLLKISNEIMELSKAESGKLKAKKNYYDIHGVIWDQIQLLSPLAAQKNIKIILERREEKIYLEFDISLIQKVITNLLSNAIKFSPNDGIITIQTSRKAAHQMIEITDTGLGIPEDEIKNLTLPYYQASNNTEDGTGIGLSLVNEILKVHDSALDISSSIGQGSSFSFLLPLPEIPQSEIIQQYTKLPNLDTQLAAIINPEKPIILAVDDSADILLFLRETLGKESYILTAKNGQEALKVLDHVSPTAIVSDYNMPIMNGIQLLRIIRKNQKYQALPFLILTGSSSEETELMTLKAGADVILQKPIQEEVLKAKITQLLERQNVISATLKTSFAHDLLPKDIHNNDLELMHQLEAIFLEHIDNGKLKSEEIAGIIGMGEKTLRNRVKKISGKTIKEYFKNFRLEKARLLIDEDYGTLGEISLATGFSSLSHFSKSYKAYFGSNPGDKESKVSKSMS